MNRQAAARYGGIAILQHWVSAALILALFGLGWWMVALPLSPSKFELYALHKSLGLMVLALSVARLVWRGVCPIPAPVDGPVWQRRAAIGTHRLLYVLLFALPLSGWLFNSFVGFPLSFFGLVNLPPLAAPAPALKESAQLAHVWLGYLLLALLAMHVAAALHHQFVKRDGTLSRMLPRLSQATRRPVTWLRLLAMLALIAPTMCRAAPTWTVLPADSSVRFQVSQAGGTIEGSFKRFDARIAFDPADLATSHVEVSVDITSVATGAAERDQELPKPDWFDVVRFPRAMFTADRFRVQGDNSYVADGMLTLRDIKLPISLPFTLEPQSAGAVVMQGTVDLDRVTFGIGQGQWATSDMVGHKVTVIVRLRAQRPG